MRAFKQPHPESLLRIPLISEMLSDPSIRFVARGTDSNWTYEKVLTKDNAGFNPSLNTCFYHAKSQLGEWMKNPEKSARAFNVRDYLIKEVFMMAHDYFHVWAYQAINELMPDLSFGTGPVREDQIENFVFCHLVTEAAATVAVDYWYLSQVELNDVVSLGTAHTGTAVQYRRQYDAELRRFGIKHKIFDQKFFTTLTEFYMTGELEDFSVSALEQSPVLLRWLEHELTYGEVQRGYVRLWFRYLSGLPANESPSLFKPVPYEKPWQKKLVKDLGSLLWRKVALGERIRFRPLKPAGWKKATTAYPIDFRFTNLNSFGKDFWNVLENEERSPHPLSREYLHHQIVSKFEFEKLDPSLVRIIGKIMSSGEVADLKYLLKQERALPVKNEPAEVFFLG